MIRIADWMMVALCGAQLDLGVVDRIGFRNPAAPGSGFGASMAAAGDVNRDGVPDIVVGSPLGPNDAVWVLLMKRDGSVDAHVRLAPEVPDAKAGFGSAVASVGDVNTDGIPDLLVGDPRRGPSGTVWSVLLRENGTPARMTEISYPGGIREGRGRANRFGRAVSTHGRGVVVVNADRANALGLLRLGEDGGLVEYAESSIRDFSLREGPLVAVDALETEDARIVLVRGRQRGERRVATWLVTVRGEVMVKRTLVDAAPISGSNSLASMGDVNGDGLVEIVSGDAKRARVTVVSLGADGDVVGPHLVCTEPKASDGAYIGRFGASVAAIGDVDGNGTPDIAVGEPGLDRIWVVLLAAGGDGLSYGETGCPHSGQRLPCTG